MKKRPSYFPVASVTAPKPLFVKVAQGAAGLGILSVFLLLMGAFGAEWPLPASIYATELAMALSLACLVVAFVNGPNYPRQTLSGLAWKLSLPFLTSWPVLYIGTLGYALGGEAARSRQLGTIGVASVFLLPLVAIGGVLAARRGREPNART